jgi:hypothetical protein
VILAQFRANSRNAALLEEFLRVRGEAFLATQAADGAAATGSAAAGPDAQVVLPGAGREKGERIPVPRLGEAVPVAASAEDAQPKPKRGWFGRARRETGADASTRV